MTINRPALEEIVRGNLDLMERKNADYGSKNISATGLVGLAVRLMDKVYRIYNITSNSQKPNFEDERETFRDIANYGLIGQMIIDGVWDDEVASVTQTHQAMKADKSPIVYLAGAIDDASPEVAASWRSVVAQSLSERGLSSFDPFLAFNLGTTPAYGKNHSAAPAIREINRCALLNSGAVLVNLLPAARPFGTIREIEFAVKSGKPVFVAGHNIDLHLDAYDLQTFSSMADATDAVVKALS